MNKIFDTRTCGNGWFWRPLGFTNSFMAKFCVTSESRVVFPVAKFQIVEICLWKLVIDCIYIAEGTVFQYSYQKMYIERVKNKVNFEMKKRLLRVFLVIGSGMQPIFEIKEQKDTETGVAEFRLILD